MPSASVSLVEKLMLMAKTVMLEEGWRAMTKDWMLICQSVLRRD
jgi:hypothetical protein